MANELKLSVQKDHTIVLENNGLQEIYNLNNTPDLTSTLVLREKATVLHQMDLTTVIQNLNNSVDLLDVAYHAVYGFDVQEQIWGLQNTLMTLNDLGINVIDDFSNQSQMAVTALTGVFDWLTKGAEVVALKKLDQLSKIASGLSIAAQELAEKYQLLANQTSLTLKETMKESNRQYDNQDQIKKEMSEFQGEQEASSAAQEAIKKRLDSLHKEYDKLSAAELAEEKHQRTMDIMGAVFTFLGSTASLAVSASSNVNPVSTTNDNAEKIETAKLEAQEAKEALATLQSKRKELNTAFEQEEDTNKKDALRIQIREQDEKIKKATELSSKKSSTLSKMSDSLKDVGAQMNQESPAKVALQESRSARLTEINHELIRLEEEGTKQLANVKKYTSLLANMVIQEHSVEAAVRSLIIAISCLKSVVVAVMDVALFWTSMEKCCRAIATSDLKDTIVSLQDIAKEERIAFYYTDSIMIPLLNYMVQWTAIKSISLDYIAAALETRKHLNTTVKTADSSTMSRIQHWDHASKLANKVAGDLGQQIKASEVKTKNLRLQ